jgi:hypothetical protein
MDDPGLIFFEEVGEMPFCCKIHTNSNSTDQVCLEHDLHRWTRPRQIIHLGHVQEHICSAKVPNRRLRCTRIRRGLDRQLHDLSSLHLLPNHCLHRALLQQQLRRDSTNVFGSSGKYAKVTPLRPSILFKGIN